MAIIRLARNSFIGLSVDVKPTTNVESGSFFTETDTAALYTWTGSAWLAIPLDHANLLPPSIHVPYNFVFANSAARIAAVYAVGDIGKFIRQTDTEDIYMLIGIGPNAFVKVSGSGTGEPNTASNVGVGGVGLYKQKTGVDLEFRNINAGSSKVTVTLDAANNEVDIDIDPGEIDHDDLGGIDADNHHNMLHAATHIHNGSDEVDGDKVDIDYSPTNYTPDTNPAEVTDTEELTAHLAGIDNAIGSTQIQQVGNKRPVRLATVAALPAYTPAGSGPDKTLTGNSNGALVVDGINVATPNRILVKNETGASRIHNGIYIVTDPGSPTTPYILTRAADYDESTEIVPGHLVQASEGNTNADTPFILTTDAPIAIESSLLEYANANVQGITSQTTVLTTANTVVDSITLAQTHSAQWLFDIYDATAGNRKSFSVIGREENLNAQLSSEFGAVGDTISYVLSVTSDGTSMQLKVQNNEANSIVVRVRKFEI